MLPGRLALAIAVSGLGAFGWLVYFRIKDRAHPEPWRLMLALVAGGAGSVGVAGCWYLVLDHFGLRTHWEVLMAGDPTTAALYALVVGGVEESAKLLPALPLALWSRNFDELLDGIVYASASAIGFAAVEAIGHLVVGDVPVSTGLLGAVTGPITHALFAAPWGLGLARARLERRPAALAIGFGISVFCHGAYDLALARPELPSWAAPAIPLLLWIWVIRAAPRLAALPAIARAPS